MKNIGMLLVSTSIFIGFIIDCNGFKEVETPIVISWLGFLLGIYLLILSDNRIIK